MGRNSKKSTLLLLLLLISAVMMLAACGGQQGQENKNAQPEKIETATKTIKWKMATSWATGIELYEDMAVVFAKEVGRMSNGRLVIEPFPAGAIAPALEVSETVSKGVAQAGHLAPIYDIGKDRTSVLFGGYAGSPNSEEMLNWIYSGGGYELWKKWREEKFNLVGFPCGIRTREVFLHSHKPVKNLADLKGLKIRTAGAWAEILPKMGASVVSLPGDEVLPALERKVIDATEWATLGSNISVGFHEIAKYIIIPGVHQPTAPMEVVINKDAWNQLPEDLKNIVETAAKIATLHSWTKYAQMDMGSIDVYKKAGNEIIVMDPSVEKETLALAKEWADQAAAQNEWFKKVLDSQRKFHEGWLEILPNR